MDKSSNRPQSKFPETVQQIEEQLYVDDYLGGADKEEKAIEMVEQTITLFSEAKLNMWSFATRSIDLKDKNKWLMHAGVKTTVIGTKLGLPSLTKEDIDLLNEYMLVMKPLAILLDIFQGEKGVFLGLGMVLPLLSKLKEQLKTKLFPNLNAIRDRVITSIDNRFGHLFDFTKQDSCTLAALTHPFFKAKWIKDKVARQEAIMLLKQLMTDVNTPIGEKSTTSITEDFLKYDLDESDESSNNNELENYLRDPDTNIAMLDKYPQLKQLFLKTQRKVLGHQGPSAGQEQLVRMFNMPETDITIISGAGSSVPTQSSQESPSL
uniref:Uncharacterized protein n=1 Tax=Daphnia galeata TaxID=27404 RepID=A0A8J2S729_9CRUS|nr:unnamed protein product [Daphnia galeata]